MKTSMELIKVSYIKYSISPVILGVLSYKILFVVTFLPPFTWKSLNHRDIVRFSNPGVLVLMGIICPLWLE